MAVTDGNCDLTTGMELLGFASTIDALKDPAEVLDRLHGIVSKHWEMNVLGALLFPLRWGDWNSLEKGRTVFLHKSAPAGWWEEHLELVASNPGPGLMMAQLAIAPFTMTETMQMLEPIGIDRWSFDLAQKYGIRDRLTCPVGGRWVVVYWSRSVLTQRLTQERRALLFLGANFAAIRLQKLLDPHAARLGKGASLTPRELAVLRLVSMGKQSREVAALLELGEETVRSHLKKAQAKLGVHSRTHAVAQAIRQRLIP
jgi:DNA-binding CsgD family transcriptional regulator